MAEYWQETGKSGYKIWRYRLVQEEAREPDSPVGSPAPEGDPDSKYSTIQRLVRNTAVTQWVKELHDFRCQICGARIEVPTGAYAEGAHIKPRGRPHSGPDIPENVLCLCPNDHVRFDRGVLVISDDQYVVERATERAVGRLRLAASHLPAEEFLSYHRALWG